MGNGQDFTASVKVCNRGTVTSYSSPRVELFLSMDAELTLPGPGNPSPGTPTDQVSIGYAEWGTLLPGQCETRSVYASATLPPDAQGDGAYYLAAAVDTTGVEQELREDNNVHVSGLMGVGYRPDLVVTGLTGPASVENGQSFTASVKVCNQGTAPTQGSYYPYYDRPRLELFLSTDAEVTLPDPGNPSPSIPMDQVSIGYVELGTLSPGQCETRSVYASTTLPPDAQGDGAYYLAAAVDTNRLEQELREDNNVRVSGLMGVGHRPDLVVTEVSGPASVRTSRSFMASVKVCNQGTTPSSGGYSSGARLELFLSEDATLSMPAPGQPMDLVPIASVVLEQPLYPAQCVTQGVHAQATLPPESQGDGAYYLAAAVDTNHVEQELREDNNLRVGGLMGVGHRPDLVVTEVNAPASVRPGQSFTASVKVCNQGTAPTSGSYPGPRLELFLSADTELTLPSPNTPSPQPMDQVSIGYVELDTRLYEGQCVTKSVPASASLPTGAQDMEAYYLAAAVDTTGVDQELREDNNVHVKGLMGVGYQPDLVVTAVSAPASVWDGQGFTASVRVCNQGTSSTSGGYYPYYNNPRVELFLSTDTELTLPSPGMPPPSQPMDQVSIGYVELDTRLYEGQCVTKNVPAYANLPPEAQDDGAYYLAAAIDTNHMEQELREDNNVHVSGLMGVGHRADLVVTAVSAPANVWEGQNFTASVKVCNQGTAPTSGSSPRPRLELFLSTDAELSLPSPGMPFPPPMDQVSIGYVELDTRLYEGQCVTKNVPAHASLPPAAQGEGAYYLATAIDTNHVEQELREDNNVRVKGLMGVGHRPDLVVTEVRAPASVWPGQNFTASVKVCNQGTAPAGGYYPTPRLELFLSMDTELTLPSPDMPSPQPMDQVSIGYVELNTRLYEGQCVTTSVPAYAHQPPAAQGEGAYHLAAAIDTNHVEQELREDNNVHVSGLMGVGNRADLVVTEVSGPASMEPGQNFTASVKVCNQGTAPTNSSGYYSMPRVELFLSADTELTLPSPGTPYPPPGLPADQQSIGYVELDTRLYAGQCVTKSVSASASPPPGPQDYGTYYLAAAVDTNHAEQELREDNNVHISGLMGVGYRADLVVAQVSAPASIGYGQSFTASVRVCNQGTAPTSSYYPRPRLELFLSADTELTLPSPGMPPPSQPMDQVSIGYVELDTQLYEGQCVTKNVPAYANLPPEAQGDGAYYLAAAVDTNHAEQELREDNNVRVGGLLGVGYRPDLVVAEVSGPASVWHGQNFTASVKVCNQGTAPTHSGSYSMPRVELFLSMDTELTLPSPGMPSPPPTDQQSIGYVELYQQLYPGQCVTKSVSAYASLPPGAQDDNPYYLAAAVDTNHVVQELREDNNVRVGGLMGVGYRADLVVTEVNAPASVWEGQSFTASVKVCNQGTSPTYGGYYPRPRLELFLSMDTELTLPAPGSPYPPPAADQQSIGYVELDQSVYPGQCVTKNVSAQAYRPPAAQEEGAYYLAAAVDTNHMEQELREDNNVHVGGLMGVGYRADLVVTEVNAPASVWPGQSFTASVKVCNQGLNPTQSGSYSRPSLELFLSTDTELTLPSPGMPLPPPGMPADQQSIGSVELDQPLYPGQCVTKNVSAQASLPPEAQGDGAYYLAAAIDTNHVEQELREDNNVRVGGLMGVGHRADLVVTQVGAPASVGYGQSFTASVKVCNQGTTPTGSSSPRVELFLSTDTELMLPDPSNPFPGTQGDQILIGSVELDQPLYPGQCVTKDVSASAYLPPEAEVEGAYHLAAIVDTNRVEQELREDNNIHVGGLMGVGSRSDLVVTEVSAPASVWPGQSFTASVKVCNQGTAPTSGGYYSGPRVELFLSMDDKLTLPSPNMPTDQILIGSVEFYEQLHPGQCVTQNVSAAAHLPSEAEGDGAYYLAAIVDTNRVEYELREDNNVHVSGLMGVGNRPDLVVGQVSAPASVGPGQSFTALVKVCNQGTAPTNGGYYSGPRVELFLSMDDELTLPSSSTPYPLVDQVSIGYVELDQALPPGQCVTKSVPASAQLPPAAQGDGAYYLAAAVDSLGMEQELREDNNLRVAGWMGVGSRADLVVSEVSGPSSMETSQSFTATVKVCNQGTAPSSGYMPRVELFLSMDDELTPPSSGMPYPPPGMPADQQSIGSVELAQALYPGQCVTKSVSASAHLPPAAQGDGAYYLAAVVDTNHVEQELREDNNVHVGGLMGVGYRADLVVTEVSGPASAEYGEGFTATVKVCNQGSVPSSAHNPRVELFLSMDDELTLPSPDMPYPGTPPARDQERIGFVELAEPLYPSQCVTRDVSAYAQMPPAAQGDGAYYLAAVVDTNHVEQELREDNNVRVGDLMGVGNQADLVVTEVGAPANVEPGQAFTATVKVCNQGTASSSGYMPRVELFLSMDDELTLPSPGMPYPPGPSPDQVSIGRVELDQPLNPGQCVTKDVSANAHLPPAAQGDGAYYLVAAVDTTLSEYELREDNNVRVRGLMGVGSQADLVVTAVGGPASVKMGEGFTATVRVCNQGTAPTQDTARLMVMLSMDAHLTQPAPGVPPPSDQMKIGDLNVEPLPAGQCVTKDLPVYPTLPPEAQGPGVFHLGAIIDTDLWVQELREDNNSWAESTLEVTP
jgi:subtilase family serine protease